MTITLRPHQVAAVDSIFEYFARSSGNPLCVIPCGGGKSLTMAAFCRRAIEEHPETKILIATHRAELISQDAAAIRMLWPEADVGTVAGVQSIVHVRDLPSFSLLLVDEAHLIAKEGDGQYRTLIKRMTDTNPQLKVIGFTGTPYRYSGGMLTRGKGKIFSSICYSLPIESLVADGYLVPLVSPGLGVGSRSLSTSGVGTSAGDFKKGELAASVEAQEDVTRAALTDASVLAANRHSWLVFCVSLEHARQAAAVLFELGISNSVVTGEDEMITRRMKIDAFKRGETRVLVSVDVLNTGFDAPCADCIVMLRPTKSTGLYIQIAGRAMRIHPGKKDSLFLDYAGVIDAHGPITDVKPKESKEAKGDDLKGCPKCDAELKVWVKECTECGFIFPVVPRPIDHAPQASRNNVMGPPPEPEWLAVSEMTLERWEKKPTEENPNPIPTVVVKYKVDKVDKLGRTYEREWLCPEHGGFARRKFEKWWTERKFIFCEDDAHNHDRAPKNVDGVLARQCCLRPIEAIAVEPDGKYTRVTKVRFATAKPLEREPGCDDVGAEDEPVATDVIDEIWGEPPF